MTTPCHFSNTLALISILTGQDQDHLPSLKLFSLSTRNIGRPLPLSRFLDLSVVYWAHFIMTKMSYLQRLAILDIHEVTALPSMPHLTSLYLRNVRLEELVQPSLCTLTIDCFPFLTWLEADNLTDLYYSAGLENLTHYNLPSLRALITNHHIPVPRCWNQLTTLHFQFIDLSVLPPSLASPHLKCLKLEYGRYCFGDHLSLLSQFSTISSLIIDIPDKIIYPKSASQMDNFLDWLNAQISLLPHLNIIDIDFPLGTFLKSDIRLIHDFLEKRKIVWDRTLLSTVTIDRRKNFYMV